MHSDEHRGFYVVRSGHALPYVSNNGITRLAAQGFQYNRGIDFSQPAANGAAARSESLNFSFSVTTEPKAPLLALGEVKLTAAYDDKNRSMLPPIVHTEERGEIAWAGAFRRLMFAQVEHDVISDGSSKTHTLMANVNLVRPAHQSEKARMIKGTVLATLLVEQRPEIVVENPLQAKGKKFTAGKVTMEIVDVIAGPKADKSYRIKLNMTDANTKVGHAQYHWLNSLHERFELLDENGKKFHVQPSGWENAEASQARVELSFSSRGPEKLGKPTKLIYNKWITMQHPVGFEFNDLPLP
jgi:hypothetical protein